MYNKITLIGNLGSDPVRSETGEGKTISKFSVATSTGKEAPTEWFNVVAFEKLAELTLQYLNKGSKVYVEGSVKTATWTGDDSVVRKSISVTARIVKFLSQKSEKTDDHSDIPF